LLEQIHIRLEEEMGFDCELKWCYDFSYNHTLSNNLIENEYDMIYVGKYNANPVISGSKKTGNFYKTIYF
jgi:isopentenyl-diphosphate delta-isomerase